MTVTLAQITRRASEQGVPAKTVERDYVLAHAVAGIAELGDPRIVFKGGTSLRMLHFENYRYSADLDYSLTEGLTEEGALGLIDRALTAVKAADNSLEDLRIVEGKSPRIAYVGPLGKERKIKLDLADDELVRNVEERPLLSVWPDLPPVTVRTYTLLEVAGEKLRCVLQRLQCRDLYDLHLLLAGHGEVDPTEAAALFGDKAIHRNLDPDSFSERFAQRVEQYAKRWERELSEHVPEEIPHFGKVEREVSRALRQAGLL